MARDESAAPASKAKEEQVFTTGAGLDVNELYTPADVAGLEYDQDLGLPGQYPFTRGPYPGMYRERIWTRRFQVGFGTPQETNERIKYLAKTGANGFVITIDLPTSYGFDSDDPISEGEVGVTGVPISTLEDLETIYSGFSPDAMSYALSIRPPVSAVTLAMLACVAEKMGVPFDKVIGTQQNDPFYQMSGGPLQTHIQFFPLDGIIRLTIDNIEFISTRMPKLNWMVTNGYNLRETGVNAVQDGAFSLGHAFDIFRMCQERGLDVNVFARRASFFLSCSIDFFEEIAKFRAMRRLYAKTMRERFGATNPECWRMRFSVQTAGNTLTTQQPQVNIIRATLECLAAAMGGAQSVHLSSYDEGLGLPTEESSRLALRTQQVIAYESGITKVVDALGGSYFVENLTDRMEEAISTKLAEVDGLGGLAECIKKGWLESQVNEARYKNQRDLDSGKKKLVGVNEFRIAPEDEIPVKIHKIRASEWGAKRAEYLRAYRAGRDESKWAEAMGQIDAAWKQGENMVPVLMNALKSKVTMGECHEAMRQAQGFDFRKKGGR
jgi:methylmalonyl-CoA mutase N-terminal domain/subunit